MKRFEKLLAMALCIVMLRVCVLAAIADEATIEPETPNVELSQEEPVQEAEIDEMVVVAENSEETVEVPQLEEPLLGEPLPEAEPTPIDEGVILLRQLKNVPIINRHTQESWDG